MLILQDFTPPHKNPNNYRPDITPSIHLKDHPHPDPSYKVEKYPHHCFYYPPCQTTGRQAHLVYASEESEDLRSLDSGKRIIPHPFCQRSRSGGSDSLLFVYPLSFFPMDFNNGTTRARLRLQGFQRTIDDSLSYRLENIHHVLRNIHAEQ